MWIQNRMINTVTKYIAIKTIKIRKSYSKVFIISLIWNDILLLLTYNVSTNCILDILSFDTELNSEELDFIRNLIMTHI
jgi:hypothetical protein